MIHEAYMPVYRCPDFHCVVRTGGSTRGSTRGPRGPKNFFDPPYQRCPKKWFDPFSRHFWNNFFLQNFFDPHPSPAKGRGSWCQKNILFAKTILRGAEGDGGLQNKIGGGGEEGEGGGGEDVTNEQTRKDRATQPMDNWRLKWAIVNICVLASLLAPKTAKHFININCANSVAVTCFSIPPESDSPRDEMIGGRLAEPNVFPWYTIFFQELNIESCYFYMLSFCVSGRYALLK